MLEANPDSKITVTVPVKPWGLYLETQEKI